jgi:hypothetical protein
LSGVRMQVIGDELQLSCTDNDLSVQFTLPVGGQGDGVVVASAKLMSDIVRAFCVRLLPSAVRVLTRARVAWCRPCCARRPSTSTRARCSTRRRGAHAAACAHHAGAAGGRRLRQRRGQRCGCCAAQGSAVSRGAHGCAQCHFRAA